MQLILSTRQLRAFLALAEQCSFTRAAETAYLSQPAQRQRPLPRIVGDSHRPMSDVRAAEIACRGCRRHFSYATLSSMMGVCDPKCTVMRVRFKSGDAGLVPSAFEDFALLNRTVNALAVTVATA